MVFRKEINFSEIRNSICRVEYGEINEDYAILIVKDPVNRDNYHMFRRRVNDALSGTDKDVVFDLRLASKRRILNYKRDRGFDSSFSGILIQYSKHDRSIGILCHKDCMVSAMLNLNRIPEICSNVCLGYSLADVLDDLHSKN